jgi:hypothetical protein
MPHDDQRIADSHCALFTKRQWIAVTHTPVKFDHGVVILSDWVKYRFHDLLAAVDIILAEGYARGLRRTDFIIEDPLIVFAISLLTHTVPSGHEQIFTHKEARTIGGTGLLGKALRGTDATALEAWP